MKKIFAILLTLCYIAGLTACGNRSMDRTDRELSKLLQDAIESIEVSGYYDGSMINAGDFVIEDFDEFVTWFSQLSLEHRTFAEGEPPFETIAGGNSYTFNINGGELTFIYADSGTTAYIVYNEEWYELSEPTEPPFSNK